MVVRFHKNHTFASHLAKGGFTIVEAVVAIALIGVGVASTLGALTKFNAIAATSRNATGASALLQNQVDLFQSMSPFNPQRIPPQVPIDTNTPPTYDMTAGPTPGVPALHVIGYQDPTNGGVVDPCSQPSTDRDTWPVYREPARWTYANAAARTGATGFVASDIGQLALQNDPPPAVPTYWRLQTTAPTWTPDTSGGIIVKGTMTCAVTDISDTTATPPTPNMYRYKAVFTIGYQYLGRGPIWNPNFKPCSSAPAVGRWEYQQSMTAIRASDI